MAPAEAERRRGFPLGWVLLAVIVVALLVRTIDVLIIVFLAIILSVYLDAVSNVLQRRLGLPRSLGLAAAVALTIGALVGVVFLIAPAVASQVQDLIANLPQFLGELDQSISRLFRSIPLLRRGVSEVAGPGLLATSLNELVGVLRGAVVPYLKGGIELIIEVVSVFVMALYLARTPSIYVEGLVALVPPERRRLARVILYDLKLTLHACVVGQLIAMLLLAVLTTLGLWLLGIPYFLAFGVFAGIAAIFVAPVVMERQVNLPPVITIAGVLLIGKLFGLTGLIVAVPILAFVMVLIRHILMCEVSGDTESE